MTTSIYIPFTYLIGWTNLSKFYYGVRYARGCHPDDLWMTYFTSSKHVLEFRKQHGEPDIIEVRQIFNDSLQAREWEHKVLRRLQVTKSEKWLNKSTSNGKFYCVGHPEETRRKIGDARKGRMVSEETRRKLSEAQKSRAPISEETRRKMIESRKGISEEARRKMSEAKRGKSHSEETRRKMSDAKKGKSSKSHSEKARRKMRESHKGMSEETRRKMSEAI